MTKKRTVTFLIYSVLIFLGVFILSSFIVKKPKILIIGDSISIGYTPFVKTYFFEKAMVSHNSGNAQHTGTGLMNIEQWLGDEQWDIIQFNWGLWDLCYRHPDSKEYGNRDKVNGKPEFSIQEYVSNLESIVTIIKERTNAKLIFATTTYVPKNEPGRHENDVQKYNHAAKIIMKKHGILVNDIYEPSINIHNTLGLGSNDVHYSKEGYKKLSELIVNFLEAQLN